VNPRAPKGGELRRAVTGTFDSLNPFIIKGVPARGRHLVFESLLKRTWDEPFSLYGLLAETIEVTEDRSSIAFTLRPEARFHDGRPITVDDVIFSWKTLIESGKANHRLYLRQATYVDVSGSRTIVFSFDHHQLDRELPLIIGLMPILSEYHYRTRKFESTTLDPPLGSGPYRIGHVDAGRSITYIRDPNYWGANLPINLGQNNLS
ncbi:MAG: ABC transporter substrate-binding protein, partial [SAR324 cluster bacterium]|nr:ABC transporter substrate-binding protein [SAR324 cluster bacterium]